MRAHPIHVATIAFLWWSHAQGNTSLGFGLMAMRPFSVAVRTAARVGSTAVRGEHETSAGCATEATHPDDAVPAVTSHVLVSCLFLKQPHCSLIRTETNRHSHAMVGSRHSYFAQRAAGVPIGLAVTAAPLTAVFGGDLVVQKCGLHRDGKCALSCALRVQASSKGERK